jgi:sugar O-acyltransferase (sialic acid O-acetyltransferase NeuD family)
VAREYFLEDSNYEVIALTADRAFIKEESVDGLPVVPFDEIAVRFPPSAADLFVAIGYSRLNQLRQQKYEEAKAMGYRLATYISSRATVLNRGNIGENCFILEDNTIQPFVSIGSNVVLWSGNHVGHHAVIRDHCFISSHVVISGRVTIGERCFIGVNSTLRDNISVGSDCLLGAGTVLLSDAEPGGVYNPQPTARSKVPSNRLRRI